MEDTVRTIYSLEILPKGDEITIRIRGNGFFDPIRYGSSWGTMVRVGRGFYSPEQVKEILGSEKSKSCWSDGTTTGVVSGGDRV